MPMGIWDLRQDGWPEQLISMATSSGHRGRQTIKRRGGGGKKGRFSLALGSSGTEVPVVDLGLGPAKGRGCVAMCGPDSKARRRKTEVLVCFRERLDGQLRANTSQDCFLHDRWHWGGMEKLDEATSLGRHPLARSPLSEGPPSQVPQLPPARARLLPLSHTDMHTTHTSTHSQSSHYLLCLGRKQLSAAKFLLAFLWL